MNKDKHILLFFLNVIFVIVGYGINTYTQQAFLGPMKALRAGLIGAGLGLLLIHFINKTKDAKDYDFNFLILAFLIFTGVFGSYNLSFAINRVITFIFPFIYLSLFFAYIKKNYSTYQTGYFLSSTFQWAYLLPIIILVLFERGALGSTDISKNVGIFVKNHYGWATCLFLLVSADLLANYELPFWRKTMTFLIIPIAVFVLMASGSRSAWVSTLLTGVVLLLRWERISITPKIGLITVTVFAASYFLADTNSAFYARWDKTERQLERQGKESGRILWATSAYNQFQAAPTQWLTGRGLFDYKGLIHTGGYHNSYLEILFGCGIFVFAYFLYLFVFRPAYFYFKYYSKHFLTFFPLLIIPFFESNLTGGQFLFFPWFSYMMFYSINPILKQKEDQTKLDRINYKKAIRVKRMATLKQ